MMKPVAIFRHASTEGPGYLTHFLDEHSVPWQLVRIDAGESVPEDSRKYSGLALMGGPMSVNDDLPWIHAVLALIRHAVTNDIPVLGHCLGGQLMSKALGGTVIRNPTKEIGWGQVQVTDNNAARAWFGSLKSFEAFHWHGETFSLPKGALHMLSSRYCTNQAFTLGKHLGLQCHVEMTEQMIRDWCEVGSDEIAACAGNPAVQSPAEMQKQMDIKLPQLHTVARHLYQRWIAGLTDS